MTAAFCCRYFFRRSPEHIGAGSLVWDVVEDRLPVADQRVFWGLLALLCWAPLPLGSNRVWAIGILVAGALALLAGAAVCWRNSADRAFARLRRFRLPLGLLAGLVTIAWLQTLPLPAEWVVLLSPELARVRAAVGADAAGAPSLDIHQSRIMASLAFAYFSVFLVAVLVVRSRERLETLAQTLVWSGVFQAALGSVLFSVGAQYRIFFVELEHTRVFGTFVYQNAVAAYLYICLSVGIGLMLARLGSEGATPENWRERLSSVLRFVLGSRMRLRLMLVVMVIGLVLTRSRMGNAAFFASMMVVGGAGILLARRMAPATILLLASLVVIDVLVIGTWVGLEKVVERVQETRLTREEGGHSESVEERSQAARAALPWVRDFALTGSGGGTFYASYFRYRPPSSGGRDFVDHAHNDFVQVAGEYGLAGLALMATLVALTLWKCLRVLAVRKSRVPRGMAFGAAMAMVALLIQSTVDFNLQIPANALTIVTVLAMAWIAADLPGRRAGA